MVSYILKSCEINKLISQDVNDYDLGIRKTSTNPANVPSLELVYQPYTSFHYDLRL